MFSGHFLSHRPFIRKDCVPGRESKHLEETRFAYDLATDTHAAQKGSRTKPESLQMVKILFFMTSALTFDLSTYPVRWDQKGS